MTLDFSAIFAGFSALFALGSVFIACRQNKTAARTAMLEALLHRRAALEEVNLHFYHILEWAQEKLSPIVEKVALKKELTDEEKQKDMQNTKAMLQKNATVIFCYRHYFDENEVRQVKEWCKRLNNSKTWVELEKLTSDDDFIVAMLTSITIPAMLKNIEKEIKDLEEKLKKSSK